VLFFIVIITFIFWGVGTKDKSTTETVVEIGKEKITVEEFWRAYERTRDTYRELYKDQPFDEIEKKLNLKQMVLNGLLEERVLLVSARELGLTASDEDLQQAIINDPRFRRDGVFKKDIYLRTLTMNRLTPDMYEGMLRDQLAVEKMRKLIISSVDINEIDLAGTQADPTKAAMIKQMALYNKRNAALRSFVEGAKARMKFKINKDIISS
jgi:peptidyl-prolyl cis-trans isomerase D